VLLLRTALLLSVLFAAALSCSLRFKETVTEVSRGAYKIGVRTQEAYHSSIQNVDICVTDVGSRQFPTDRAQCFLHGFDFSMIAVKWVDERNVEISFDCGRVVQYSNFAQISKGHDVPVEFRATLIDRCNPARDGGASGVVGMCIEVAHIGSEDSPVGTLRLCVGEKGGSRADSLLQNKWTFYFDATTYRVVEKFVVNHINKDPADAGSEIEGSFAVTWGVGNAQGTYVLPTRRKCAYLRELVQTVAGEEYAEFRRVGWDMMAREGCPPPR
jgi:hypothetical protein